jgi:hypothetical protein
MRIRVRRGISKVTAVDQPNSRFGCYFKDDAKPTWPMRH